MLDRGLEDDRFGSPFIVTFAVLSALPFVRMIPWKLSRRNPMIGEGAASLDRLCARRPLDLAAGAGRMLAVWGRTKEWTREEDKKAGEFSQHS